MVDLGVGALGWASVLGKDGDGSPAAAIWALDLILDALNVILSFSDQSRSRRIGRSLTMPTSVARS